jgi:cobalt-zinc-cadmium efflux system outer membrane protein
VRSGSILALIILIPSALASASAAASAPASAPAAPSDSLGPAALTMDQAVQVALQQSREVVAARLDIEAAELDVVAARIYPNPVASYGLSNLVLGNGNSQGTTGSGAPLTSPGFASQPVHTIGVSELCDVWAKRGARAQAAERGVTQRRLLVEDLLREIVYAVRSAFAEVTREQQERQMAREIADRYVDTVRLSRGRFRAGDISEAELRRVELEGLRYTNAVIDADLQLDLAREKLVRLMGLPSVGALPPAVAEIPDTRRTFAVPALVAQALEQRPDLRAAGAARRAAQAQREAAEREVYPDLTLGASYTHSQFTVAGDNPDTLGLALTLPLPLFDRNQANIGRAALDIRRADNDAERLRLAVAHDVAEAVRRAERARALLDVFEGPSDAEKGGMLARAETTLRVAEKSYQAGAISLLELLDAQRTYLDVRGQYLRAGYDYRQATIDVGHAVGTEVK